MSNNGMPLFTEDQIANTAEQACFYVTPSGVWLRMDFCDMDEGYFQAHDEDSGEEYRIDFVDLVYETPEFHKLVQMEVTAA